MSNIIQQIATVGTEQDTIDTASTTKSSSHLLSISSTSHSFLSISHHHPRHVHQESVAASVYEATTLAYPEVAMVNEANNQERRCSQMVELFSGLNVYFRDENLLPGSEHSSVLIGHLIVLAYTVVIMFGALGNLLTIAAVLRNRTNQMRTVRNFFIINLALSDFFICTVTAPTTLYTVLYVFWPHGVVACKIAGMLQGFNIFLSTFSITAIALDRYVLVIFPTRRQRQQRLSLALFVSMWLISIVLALPLFVASDLNNVFNEDQCGISLQICQERNERWEQIAISKEMYTVGVLVFQYAVPLASIVFAYSRIAMRMTLRKSFAAAPGGALGSSGSAQAQPHQKHSHQPQRSSSGAGSSLLANALLTNMINGSGVAAGSGLVISAAQQAGSNTAYYYGYAYHHHNGGLQQPGSVPSSVCSALIDLRKKSIQERNRRTNLLLIALVAVFATAWLPLNIFHIVNTLSHGTRSFSVSLFALCHVMAICSACLNPVSYAFFNKNFRNEFIVIARSIGLMFIYTQFVGWSKCRTANGGTVGGIGTGSLGKNNLVLNRRPCLIAKDAVGFRRLTNSMDGIEHAASRARIRSIRQQHLQLLHQLPSGDGSTSAAHSGIVSFGPASVFLLAGGSQAIGSETADKNEFGEAFGEAANLLKSKAVSKGRRWSSPLSPSSVIDLVGTTKMKEPNSMHDENEKIAREEVWFLSPSSGGTTHITTDGGSLSSSTFTTIRSAYGQEKKIFAVNFRTSTPDIEYEDEAIFFRTSEDELL